METIKIYTPILTNRLRYIAQLFFEDLMGLPIEWHHDKAAFKAASQRAPHLPFINYSQQYISEHSLWIPAHDLLFEKGIDGQGILMEIHQEEPVFEERNGLPRALPYFFGNHAPHTFLPFDVLAMCFYLVTRYEEYLPYQTDEHDRFPATASLAYQEKFLDIPLVNLWARRVGLLLRERFTSLSLRFPSYQFLPTIDVDMAWAYQHKGFWRSSGAVGKALFDGNFSELGFRWSVMSGAATDPFNRFLYLAKAHSHVQAEAVYFFLVGKHGEYDKNADPADAKFQALIQAISDQNDVGLHPSYGSNSSTEQLFAERQILQKIIDKVITKSRQHYLKLHLPQTYRQLIELGITDDYSMGYAAAVGFRVSMATPFYWYDLEREEATRLRVHPFQVMDVTLKNYLQLEPAAAQSLIDNLIAATREVGGQFCSIWHNSSFSVAHGWQGWQAVYDHLLQSAKEVV